MEVSIRNRKSTASGARPSAAGGGLIIRKSMRPGNTDQGSLFQTSNNAANQQRETVLTMYQDSPTEDITLADMEELGYNRLQLLKAMENVKATAKSTPSNPTQSIMDPTEFYQLQVKYGMLSPRGDLISHFLLRLAFSKTEELRKWYSDMETALFKQRFECEDEYAINSVLAASGLNYAISPCQSLDEEVSQRLQQMPNFSMLASYIKLPFEDAWELLRGRQCVVIGGFAYISRPQLSRVMATKFKVHLRQQLAHTHRALQNFTTDQRVQPLVNALSKQYVGSQYKSVRISGAVSRDQIPALADRSFPLCMSNLYSQLHQDNHLKHGGRMQFGLFLKGIGLTMEDSLAFWRAMFSRRTAGDKFDRQYGYNIRHSYGKEGKRTDYSPWSCMKIINSQPGQGDHHGCPFKHHDENHLRQKMRGKNVNKENAEEILQLVKDHHFQVACKRCFTATHNGFDSESVGNHPNGYLDSSMKYYAAATAKPEQTFVKVENTHMDVTTDTQQNIVSV